MKCPGLVLLRKQESRSLVPPQSPPPGFASLRRPLDGQGRVKLFHSAKVLRKKLSCWPGLLFRT